MSKSRSKPRAKQLLVESAGAVTVAPSKPVLPERVDQTMRWLIEGERDLDILRMISESWPDQDLKNLMTEVLSKFREAAETPPDFVRGWIYESRKELYRNLVQAGEYDAALKALRDMEAANR